MAAVIGGVLGTKKQLSVKERKGERKEERKQVIAEQEAAATEAVAAEKKRKEAEEAAIAEEKRRKKYGRRGFPMETYLGEEQAGVRKTLLGG